MDPLRYEIVVHELALEELAALRAFDQRRILADIRALLTDQPNVPTRRRKCLVDLTPSFEHELPIWDCRIGEFRVFLRRGGRVATCVHSGRAPQTIPAADGGYHMRSVAEKELQINLDAISEPRARASAS